MRGHRTLLPFILVLLVSVLGVAPVFAVDIPGVRTPIPIIRNMLSNGDFESGVNGWLFGNMNRALIQGGAASENYWLNTTNCSNCPTDFGDAKTLAYDVSGDIAVGQQYSASVFFRSPQGGTVEFVVWALGGTSELFSTFHKVGTGDWQKLEINNFQILNSGHTSLRVQVYIKNIADSVQYQFDNFTLMNNSGWNCPNSYYTYQQPLTSGVPTLSDLFAGQAHFQSLQESQELSFSFNPTEQIYWYGSKLPILFNSQDGKYYGFTRGTKNADHFNMYLLVSDDAVHFTEVGPIFDESVRQSFSYLYDGHIAVDYSVCPPRYVMAIEVGGAFYSSFTTTPFVLQSWSNPVKVVWPAGPANNQSASTPVFLIDGIKKYASWTVLDNVTGALNGKTTDTGTESTYSRAIAINDYSTFLGDAEIGSVVMPAEPNTHCTSSWDCNNRDVQDWKKEGNYYYLIYNGANYYSCGRFPNDRQYTNEWGLGIVKSISPLGGYDMAGVGEIIKAPRNDGCAISYPVINAVNGELYMYYAGVRAQGGDFFARSKLVWNAPVPGDVTGDRKVNVSDILKLVTQWQNPYTIFDYNLTVANYGRQ